MNKADKKGRKEKTVTKGVFEEILRVAKGSDREFSVRWSDDGITFTSTCDCEFCSGIEMQMDWEHEKELLVHVEFKDYKDRPVRVTLGAGQLMTLAPRLYDLGFFLNEAEEATHITTGIQKIFNSFFSAIQREGPPPVNTTDQGEA